MAVDKILILALIWTGYASCCQFPGEIQGMFSTQALTNPLDSTTAARTLRDEGVPTLVTIDHSSISTWGTCAARHKQYYILSQRFSRGGSSCYRCVHLLVASPLVVVATSRKDERCFPSIEEAKESCSPIIHHHTNHHVEAGDQGHDQTLHHTYDNVKTNLELIKKDVDQIILYKVKSAHDETDKIRVECPIRGVFAFTYEKRRPGAPVGNRRAQREVKCPHPTSEMTNCPYGSGMNLIYRDCSVGQPEQVELECLGGWKGSAGVRYLAVQDKSVRVGDTNPKFRCGMYREDAVSGLIHLAFSKDSTCDNMLSSPVEGYETYTLTAVPAPPLPSLVLSRGCRFPPSLQGDWGPTTVGRDTIHFKDDRTLKRYKAVCVEDTGDGEHFVVYSRSQCGDPTYNCLWLKRRSANVLEYMLGLHPNESYAHSSLCHSDKFGAQNTWVTVAKTVLDTPTRCPVVGRFVGELPDASGYCGRLQSHCNKPDVMTYTVTECGNAASAYEHSQSSTEPTPLKSPFPLPPKHVTPPPAPSFNLPPEIQVSVLPVDNTGRKHSRTPTEIIVSNEGPNGGHRLRLPPPLMSSTVLNEDSNLQVPPELSVSTNVGGGHRHNSNPNIVQPELVLPSQNKLSNYPEEGVNTAGIYLTIRDPRDRSRRSASPVTTKPRMSRARTTTIKFQWGGQPTTPSSTRWQVPTDTKIQDRRQQHFPDSKIPDRRQQHFPESKIPDRRQQHFPDTELHDRRQQQSLDDQFSRNPSVPSSNRRPYNPQIWPDGNRPPHRNDINQDDSRYVPGNEFYPTRPTGSFTNNNHRFDDVAHSQSIDNRRAHETNSFTEQSRNRNQPSNNLHASIDLMEPINLPENTNSKPVEFADRRPEDDLRIGDARKFTPPVQDDRRFHHRDHDRHDPPSSSHRGSHSILHSGTLSTSVPRDDTRKTHSGMSSRRFDLSDSDLENLVSQFDHDHFTPVTKSSLFEHSTNFKFDSRVVDESRNKYEDESGYWSEDGFWVRKSSGNSGYLKSNVNLNQVVRTTSDSSVDSTTDIFKNANVHRELISSKKLPPQPNVTEDSSHITIEDRLTQMENLAVSRNQATSFSFPPDSNKLNSGGRGLEDLLVDIINFKKLPAIRLEEREYRCLGEWMEGGKTFALTYRLDTHTHECFVGVETPDGRVFIKEADGGIGGSCGRTVKPEKMGMELQQRAECSTSKPPVVNSHPPPIGPKREKSPSPSPPRTPGRPPWQRGKLDATTKPWKPITAPPRRQRSDGDGITSSLPRVMVMLLLVRLLS